MLHAIRRTSSNLTLQVIVALCAGAALGVLWPGFAVSLQALSDTFIKLIKMVIPPIAFLTIVIGIAEVSDLKKVGRIGGSALPYFEVASTLALIIGLIVVNLVRPGDGFDRSRVGAVAVDVTKYASASADRYMVDLLSNIVPDNAVAAFAKGDLLQIVFFAIAFGCAAVLIGERAKPFVVVAQAANDILFQLVALIMRLAPLGAFGAMAFTVGRYGVGSILVLGHMLLSVYLTCALFVAVVLGAIARAYGFSLFRFIRYIGAEVLIVLGTCSSESVLPRLMTKLQRLGCSKSSVGLVLPVGYSFNADGTAIYLSMASLFIAQAYGIDMSFGQQLGLLLLLLVTSKGSGSVAGSGFVVLAATLSATHVLPVEGLLLISGLTGVSVLTTEFEQAFRSQRATIGLDAASVYVSHPMQNKTTAELHLSADLAFPAILQAITAEADLTPRSEAA
ncbi:cation:dicarboxylase symporter family transporter [Methylobacterium sp. NEAU 140]|uniref:cation:dicarboxylate symporter family transporter n=1 Tax=Methylobacterium sp. NEAU 140 TaxID=3064945 RepID=UPI0027332E41|nr:cation:dicarboxylase symporter family transporter [Methylobacterium sp. NEAU 140]MDP4025193.1 cation:dicarboxylase symporter family transporter [Methylobacterium sp. NEAU 140]